MLLRRLGGILHRSNNRLLHVNFLWSQLVDLAVPFSIVIGGLGGTFSEKPGGLGGTFFQTRYRVSSLWINKVKESFGYAKVLFTNLIETKAGQSPNCLKEKIDCFSIPTLVRESITIHHKKETGGQVQSLLTFVEISESLADNTATELTFCQFQPASINSTNEIQAYFRK